MNEYLTETCTHKRSDGTTLTTIASGIAISPIDPMVAAEAQAYPLDKLYMARQCFTEYTAFQAGDQLIADSTTYIVKAVHPWAAQGSLSIYYHLVLEENL